jgi:hypothetical protein
MSDFTNDTPIVVPLTQTRTTASEVDEEVEQCAIEQLRSEAGEVQKLVMNEMVHNYTEGRMAVATIPADRKVSPEKMFRVSGLLTWLGGDPSNVVDEMRKGRVRARVDARMGLGKSTKLAPYIARELGCRVLYISLNALALQQVAVYVDEMGLGRFRRDWASTPSERVCCMTYGDFHAFVCGQDRKDLFACFDVMIFDESSYSSSDVWVVKRCFSVYAPASTHLLLCSATLRTDREGGVAESVSMGNFNELQVSVSVEEAIASGKLVADYLVDRTYVFVPTHLDIGRLYQHYSDSGVDVRELHSASDYEELRDIDLWLKGDSSVPRVVVAHERFSICFNFRVAWVLLWAQREALEVEGDSIVSRVVPLAQDMVSQAKARTGRNIVEGSGGMVATSERAEYVELYASERYSAFVKLCAASITPLRSSAMWKECYEQFPNGLPAAVAFSMLKLGMPMQCAAKFFCSDGKVAAKFCTALGMYTQPDHYLQPSRFDLPDGYEQWPEECIGGYSGAGAEGSKVRVPFRTTGELRVVLHSIAVMADEKIEMRRWRPIRVLALDDGRDVQVEYTDRRFNTPPHFRRVVERVKGEVEQPVTVPIPWTYSASGYVPPGRRSGGEIDVSRFAEAIAELESSLFDYVVPPSPGLEVTDAGVGLVKSGETGRVESPGGSVICQFPLEVCQKLNVGENLNVDEMVVFVAAARDSPQRFATSKLFDCFSGPWDSVLYSMQVMPTVLGLKKRGFASDAYMLIDYLRRRFSMEVCTVLSRSNVYEKKFLRFFKRNPSTDELMEAIKKGSFDSVAQSKGFLDRVRHIKTQIDNVLLFAEEAGMFLPGYITAAQRGLAIRGITPVGVLGEGMRSMPKMVAKRVQASDQSEFYSGRAYRSLSSM